ncbi:hypothetical protein GK047_07980 [Paenibacillus sp. SYP-B3998]|uniref:YheC/YheD family protein n=2 Tax=Paenibacillus sp. SYP-B3998 TaxID=2678564 RepID=A0A6G3ZUP8_9BACL|nr:hypothetical protein [Paenibacillus sp. SYP-B3998]
MRISHKLDSFLPDTQYMTNKSLWSFVKKYKAVMLKPCNGSLGKGVVQVTSIARNKFAIRSQKRVITLSRKKVTYAYLKKITGFRRYIVQRYIPLATINGLPFDLRIMVQRRKNSPWKVTGRLAKVAKPGYIVTNVTKTILPVRKAILLSTIKPLQLDRIISKIDNISLLTVKQIGPYYQDFQTVGLDIGLDNKGRVWVIEANLKPNIFPFLLLEDKTMYQRIMLYNNKIKT